MAPIARHSRIVVIALATLGLAAFGSLLPAQGAHALDPTGRWSGPYKSTYKEKGKTRENTGTLVVAFGRDGTRWKATGGMKSEGRPLDESPFEQIRVAGDSVSFNAVWGPTVVTFKGRVRADTIRGTMRGESDGQLRFAGTWTIRRAK